MAASVAGEKSNIPWKGVEHKSYLRLCFAPVHACWRPAGAKRKQREDDFLRFPWRDKAPCVKVVEELAKLFPARLLAGFENFLFK